MSHKDLWCAIEAAATNASAGHPRPAPFRDGWADAASGHPLSEWKHRSPFTPQDHPDRLAYEEGYAANRARPNTGKHFQAYCGIGPQDPGCPGRKDHDFGEGRTTGRCMTEYLCAACGVKMTVDSSD